MDHILQKLGLSVDPDKTRSVELTDGQGRLWLPGLSGTSAWVGRLREQRRIRRYYLQRWPRQRAMRRVRERVRQFTPRGRCHADMRRIVAELNPVPRGWSQYFRSGNA
jgi:RNA-directed DNA polymerase